MTSPTLTAWQSGNIRALAATVTHDVVFSSPATDYRGHAAALHIIGLIAEVLEEPARTGRWGDERDTLSRFRARIGDDELNGVLHEEYDATGQLTHITLFLRPYAALRAAIGEMRRLLEQSPLPIRST